MCNGYLTKQESKRRGFLMKNKNVVCRVNNELFKNLMDNVIKDKIKKAIWHKDNKEIIWNIHELKSNSNKYLVYLNDLDVDNGKKVDFTEMNKRIRILTSTIQIDEDIEDKRIYEAMRSLEKNIVDYFGDCFYPDTVAPVGYDLQDISIVTTKYLDMPITKFEDILRFLKICINIFDGILLKHGIEETTIELAIDIRDSKKVDNKNSVCK
jgi:hypothetical protein